MTPITPSSTPSNSHPAPTDGATEPPPQILLIEDVNSLRGVYETHLRQSGYEVQSAASAAEGMELFRNHLFDIVLLDLMLPDRDGDLLIPEMLALRPRCAIVVVTADRSIDRAVQAMRSGAVDVLIKPVNGPRLSGAIETARPRADDVSRLGTNGHALDKIGSFIGESPQMESLYGRIRAAARSTAPVFIWGESGTGKELCAQSIHAQGARKTGPFVTLDCGALAPDRLDSELFGHRRGAFAGAISDNPGALQRAHGGTLLLDNICDLEPALQTKLLRFLQSGHVKPFGAVDPLEVDVRVLAADSIAPHEAVAQGRLREDLHYRLHVLSIEMPPLRSHPEDIPQIAMAILERFSNEEQRDFSTISATAMTRLTAHDWPGNVRQLMNVLRAAVVMHDGPELTEDMLPEATKGAPRDGVAMTAHPERAFAGRSLAEIERIVIEGAISRHDGSIPRAAHELGVAPSTIYRKRDTWLRQDRRKSTAPKS